MSYCMKHIPGAWTNATLPQNGNVVKAPLFAKETATEPLLIA